MQVWTVSELISVINQTLDYAYPSVALEGEVASFKISKSKYVFFDIKDQTGVINCFMMIYQLRLPLEDGMRVRLIAQPQLTAWGKFSLTVREVLPIGQGSIKRASDLLKAKLAAEGLFDPQRKRPLPRIPQRVGVVCSVESAGYADFIKVLNSRWCGLELHVADVQVQGARAGEQLVRAVDFFNQQADLVDVLVVIRGGGSAEDLAVFNEEPLVRAIAGSRIPTLVGVGHEVDTSLCDLAADLRAATPSNAAQLLVPDRHELARNTLHQQKHLLQRLDHRLATLKQHLVAACQHMSRGATHTLTEYKRLVHAKQQVLGQLDPQTVLRRGYAIVRTGVGQLVHGAATVKVGDELTINTNYAIITAGVKYVQQRKDEVKPTISRA